MTLFLHETHRVRGALEEKFEAHYRDRWMAALAEGDDARLLWYVHQAHGTGPAYRICTITAVRDGAAYGRLLERVATGDLQSWARELDDLVQRLDAASSPDEVAAVGVDAATEVCRRLLDAEMPGIHLYPMNRSESVRRVFENLGLQ